MSDPFQHAERTHGVTRHFLQLLLDYQYPTVISTRSTMVATSPYLELLGDMKSVVVQFSFTSIVDKTSQALERHTPKPAELLRTMERLANLGIVVTCRWQPYVPGLSESPRKFVREVVAAGACHIAIEHLKLPVERNHFLWSDLAAAPPSLWNDYRKAGATLMAANTCCRRKSSYRPFSRPETLFGKRGFPSASPTMTCNISPIQIAVAAALIVFRGSRAGSSTRSRTRFAAPVRAIGSYTDRSPNTGRRKGRLIDG